MGENGVRRSAQKGNAQNDRGNQQKPEYLPLAVFFCVAGLPLTHLQA